MRETPDNIAQDEIDEHKKAFKKCGGKVEEIEQGVSSLVEGMFLKDKKNSQKRAKKK